ncbi:MAG TPA: hypothetical protein VHN77_13645 [Phycisphaerales bacterium]|nr:hypothetical protein [Phycisphaerales bacterium]
MTTRELLENANLAALGLLDGDEHAAYERALGKAPEAVREHILREQARWSGGGELLPAVEAPEHLRERVMDAVRGAIVDDEIAQSAGGFEAGAFGGRRGVSPLWRGGALGLLCGVVALSGVLFFVRSAEKESSQQLASGSVTEALRGTFGYKFVDDVVFDASTRKVTFEPVGSFAGEAVLYSNDQWAESRAVMNNMPMLGSGERYALVQLDADGKYAGEIGTFDGSGQLSSIGVEKVERGTQVAIVVAGVGRAATAERLLMVARVV